MNQKRTVTMCVTIMLIAILGGILLWNRNMQGIAIPTLPTLSPTETLISRQESDMESVIFNWADGESYTMEKNTRWIWQSYPDYILNPIQARDKVRFAWFLTASERAFDDSEGLDLSEFGLAPPNLTLTANYTDSTSKNIYLGGLTADMRHNFIQVSGSSAIYLVPTQAATLMQTSLPEILDRNLPFFTQGADFIYISQQGRPSIELGLETPPDLEFIPRGDLVLTMRRPTARPLHFPNLNDNLLTPINNLAIGETVSLRPNDLNQYGLYNPALEFIYQEGGERVHLLFGDTFLYDDTLFIYVKFADRPHVFKAVYAPVTALKDINLFTIADRFIALINIQDVERIAITSPLPERNLDIVINHITPYEISPEINNVPVEEENFRRIYRNLIALSADAEIEIMPPEDNPILEIVFNQINSPNTHLQFFQYDANFYAVSINGDYPWFVTNIRDIDSFFSDIYI